MPPPEISRRARRKLLVSVASRCRYQGQSTGTSHRKKRRSVASACRRVRSRVPACGFAAAPCLPLARRIRARPVFARLTLWTTTPITVAFRQPTPTNRFRLGFDPRSRSFFYSVRRIRARFFSPTRRYAGAVLATAHRPANGGKHRRQFCIY